MNPGQEALPTMTVIASIDGGAVESPRELSPYCSNTITASQVHRLKIHQLEIHRTDTESLTVLCVSYCGAA
jgi:hypothetical protein